MKILIFLFILFILFSVSYSQQDTIIVMVEYNGENYCYLASDSILAIEFVKETFNTEDVSFTYYYENFVNVKVANFSVGDNKIMMSGKYRHKIWNVDVKFSTPLIINYKSNFKSLLSIE